MKIIDREWKITRDGWGEPLDLRVMGRDGPAMRYLSQRRLAKRRRGRFLRWLREAR